MIFPFWAHATPPEEGELLSSALVRIAHAHGLSAWRFSNLHWPGNRVWTRDLDRFAPGFVLDLWADHAAISRQALWRASLLPEIGVLGAGRAVIPMIAAASVRNTFRRLHALACCPECLAERPGVWLKAWRRAFVIACPRHRRLLLDACAACGAVLEPHRNQALGHDCCATCGADLRATRSDPVDRRAFALQRRLSKRLDALVAVASGAPTFAALGTPAPGTDLADCRALIAVASAAAVRRKIAAALDPGTANPTPGERAVFELARLAWRHATLALVARWLEDWPDRFLDVARYAGVSQRSFARLQYGPALRSAVLRLPETLRRRKPPVPSIHDAPTRRLRRRDPAAYRALRAARLLGVAPDLFDLETGA